MDTHYILPSFYSEILGAIMDESEAADYLREFPDRPLVKLTYRIGTGKRLASGIIREKIEGLRARLEQLEAEADLEEV